MTRSPSRVPHLATATVGSRRWTRLQAWLFSIPLALSLCGCRHQVQGTLTVEDLRERPPGFPYGLPQGAPVPLTPADNPISAEKVELGRFLFYDRRLSANQTQACADCHRQEIAFTDGRKRSLGSTGEDHPRSAMSLTNVAYNASFTWADPSVRSLERQALIPMFNRQPIELGMSGHSKEILKRFEEDPDYQRRFDRAFPDRKGEISIETVTWALASFQRTLLSFDSPYDRLVLAGEMGALSHSAKRGMRLFFSEALACSKCHSGFNFSGPVVFEGNEEARPTFHNTGLYNLKGNRSYPPEDTGLAKISRKRSDVGRFRAPTLRNIAVTSPYMHDGSIETLSDVIDHYARGGRHLSKGPHQGDGSKNPNKSRLVTGFAISSEEKGDLIEFLESLTDPTFLTNPRLSNPTRSNHGVR